MPATNRRRVVSQALGSRAGPKLAMPELSRLTAMISVKMVVSNNASIRRNDSGSRIFSAQLDRII